MRPVIAVCLGTMTAVLLVTSIAQSAETDTDRLARELQPLLASLSGQQEAFTLTGDVQAKFDGQTQKVAVRLVRFGDDSFDLELTHSEYSLRVIRRADITSFALPNHKTVFVGQGKLDPIDHLAPRDITRRLISQHSMVSAVALLAQQSDPKSVAQFLTGLLKARRDERTGQWKIDDDVEFRFAEDGQSIDIAIDDTKIHLHVTDVVPTVAAADEWPGMKIVKLDRRELERQLARGIRRALEIAAPSPLLTSPQSKGRKVANGELRWIEGQRVVLLSGSPEEIGRAHGRLLRAEAIRCIDSVLYTFGTVQTIRTGRWFRHDLDAAHARLAPHIPERHKLETRALAASLELDPKIAEAINVFPELFHCSGFAVFGDATKNGKLYHGRVLDYMTTIGLQDAATTFIVAADGQIPFANIGYAGFIGSVSGMNARGISLGEMGGRGEGLWDGVPMATLMRRALEECSTLDEVMSLWKNNPRTCEYYYVFADGKTNDAVGVAAVPDSIEFVFPGQSDERLGEGIKDTVVLSAGSRLAKLRERISAKYGQIDVDVAQWLMSRPVAMQSNLHNVLFVPQDGILYVANADHKRPAAERPYVRLDLNALLATLPDSSTGTAAEVSTGTDQ